MVKSGKYSDHVESVATNSSFPTISGASDSQLVTSLILEPYYLKDERGNTLTITVLAVGLHQTVTLMLYNDCSMIWLGHIMEKHSIGVIITMVRGLLSYVEKKELIALVKETGSTAKNDIFLPYTALRTQAF